MARIGKEDHARILHLVDVEHRHVRNIAAEYGCSPANIYALLARLRREAGTEAEARPADAQPPLALEVATAEWIDTAAPLPAAPEPAGAEVGAQSGPGAEAAPHILRFAPPPPPAPRAERDHEERGALGSRLAKPGMGLVTRGADGEESMMPFRSLDDLLSAIKPILREGARSPEPVWFSLQPIDLATIEVDAA